MGWSPSTACEVKLSREGQGQGGLVRRGGEAGVRRVRRGHAALQAPRGPSSACSGPGGLSVLPARGCRVLADDAPPGGARSPRTGAGVCGRHLCSWEGGPEGAAWALRWRGAAAESPRQGPAEGLSLPRFLPSLSPPPGPHLGGSSDSHCGGHRHSGVARSAAASLGRGSSSTPSRPRRPQTHPRSHLCAGLTRVAAAMQGEGASPHLAAALMRLAREQPRALRAGVRARAQVGAFAGWGACPGEGQRCRFVRVGG